MSCGGRGRFISHQIWDLNAHGTMKPHPAFVMCSNSNCDVIFDSIDENCPECDWDMDGYIDVNCGGNDCDDGNYYRNPGVAENCQDNIENDCDGDKDCEDEECWDFTFCLDPPADSGCLLLHGLDYCLYPTLDALPIIFPLVIVVAVSAPY